MGHTHFKTDESGKILGPLFCQQQEDVPLRIQAMHSFLVIRSYVITELEIRTCV